jgi:hypothetical protein
VTRQTLAARRDLLALVLDTLVPASGEFPGAGAVALDHVLAVAAASADAERLLPTGWTRWRKRRVPRVLSR